MSKFEVGRKWVNRRGDIANVIFSGESRCVVVLQGDLSYSVVAANGRFLLDGSNHSYDLIEPFAEQKFRPFADADEFKKYRDEWVKFKQSDSGRVIRCHSFSEEGVGLALSYLTYEVAFREIVFEDGTPFGIEVAS